MSRLASKDLDTAAREIANAAAAAAAGLAPPGIAPPPPVAVAKPGASMQSAVPPAVAIGAAVGAAAAGAAGVDGNAHAVAAAAATQQLLYEQLLEHVCPSARDEWKADSFGGNLRLSIVVLGASGDLAKKKTYPALYQLFKKGFLPRRLQIVGYARSRMSTPELRERLRGYLDTGDCECVEQFLNACSYMHGEYDAAEGYERLGTELSAWEAQMSVGTPTKAHLAAATAAAQAALAQAAAGANGGAQAVGSPPGVAAAAAAAAAAAVGSGLHGAAGPGPRLGRLFYLALPPVVYPQVCEHLRNHCATLFGGGGGGGGGDRGGRGGAQPAQGSFVRLILEKPFGSDLASSEALANSIGAHWPEEQLYRIDHYLGKELVQNMLMLRFANPIFSAFFNRHYISNIQITFKEPFGTEGRGGYFDSYGIIRDVIQNHLAQVLALLTMEAPVSLHPDDIRDEKVKVLRCIAPAGLGDCVLGQYVADKGQPGYLDDPTVHPGSRTPTFAAVRVFVRNERWDGVPIVIKAGKALNERLAAVRIQLRTPPASIFGPLDHMRNELVVRFQPGEAIYAKMVVKKPGLEMDFEMSELDLSYPERYKGVVIPDAYERLILDCIRGDQQHFVRRDELRAAWAIFTPLLHAIDAGAVPLHPYPYGSRGPAAVDGFITDSGYVRTEYSWQQAHPSHHPQMSTPAQLAAAAREAAAARDAASGAAAPQGAAAASGSGGADGVSSAPTPAGKL